MLARSSLYLIKEDCSLKKSVFLLTNSCPSLQADLSLFVLWPKHAEQVDRPAVDAYNPVTDVLHDTQTLLPAVAEIVFTAQFSQICEFDENLPAGH